MAESSRISKFGWVFPEMESGYSISKNFCNEYGQYCYEQGIKGVEPLTIQEYIEKYNR